MQAAHNRNIDVLIVDTAGRLHTKHNLMAELQKLRKIMQRHVPDAPQEVVLVIDATTGQNGLVQAAEFSKSVEITDIMISKLDSTAKGGIAFSVAQANWARRSPTSAPVKKRSTWPNSGRTPTSIRSSSAKARDSSRCSKHSPIA